MCTYCFSIQSSKYAIVDVSKQDTQTLYEVGLLHALGIPTLMLKHNSANILPTFHTSNIQEFDTDDSLEITIEGWLKEFFM